MGALVSRIAYDVPASSSGLVGRIRVDAQPSVGANLSTLVNSSNVLQWDLSTPGNARVTLNSGATIESALRIDSSRPLWALSSVGLYGDGSFMVNTMESVTNSVVEISGSYLFGGAHNWYSYLD